jgi:hypothetical protein
VPATNNERRRGQPLSTKIKYLRRSTSGTAGNRMRTTIKCLRGAAGIGLGTATKYLRCATNAAAGNGMGTTIKYLVNQNAGAGTNLVLLHKGCARILLNPPIV